MPSSREASWEGCDVEREANEAMELLEATVARQAQTQELLSEVAEDMRESRALLQRKISLLTEARQEKGLKELQDLERELAGQMKLVAESGLLMAGDEDREAQESDAEDSKPQ